MKKTIKVLLICLIIAGIIVISTVGFNVGLKYSAHTEISINIGKEFEIADVKEITKEVFGKETVLVQQVELYKDMVQITVKNVSEEQISNLNEKINEKYEIENQVSDIKVVNVENVRLRSIIKPYIIPIIIVSVITVILSMIIFRKLGVLSVGYESALAIVAPQAVLASIYAVIRIPVNRLTSIVAIIVFIMSITLSMIRMNKEIEEKAKTVKSKE